MANLNSTTLIGCKHTISEIITIPNDVHCHLPCKIWGFFEYLMHQNEYISAHLMVMSVASLMLTNDPRMACKF